jgi:hypothetical protein
MVDSVATDEPDAAFGVAALPVEACPPPDAAVAPLKPVPPNVLGDVVVGESPIVAPADDVPPDVAPATWDEFDWSACFTMGCLAAAMTAWFSLDPHPVSDRPTATIGKIRTARLGMPAPHGADSLQAKASSLARLTSKLPQRRSGIHDPPGQQVLDGYSILALYDI